MLIAGLWDRSIGFKQAVGLMAQGQQRGLDATGKVFPFREPSPQLLVRFFPGTISWAVASDLNFSWWLLLQDCTHPCREPSACSLMPQGQLQHAVLPSAQESAALSSVMGASRGVFAWTT